MSLDEPQDGDLKVWWIPQVPMKPFEVLVSDLKTAAIICDVLADYDAFQFENNIKPDYFNAGGVARFDGSEWWDVDDSELDAALDSKG